jgi:hypothetical protein
MGQEIRPGAPQQTVQEQEVAEAYARVFTTSAGGVELKLGNFPKYVRRQDLGRLLALYELFKKVVGVKGSIVECGVYQGFGLMAWANLSAMLEPVNFNRRIYGFDTFSGFAGVSDHDQGQYGAARFGDLSAGSYEELSELIRIYDSNRFLGHVGKVELIKGDARETIPEFVTRNPHLVVSLLFLDFDLYEPTKVAIEHFVPRMPKGAVIALDELDNPRWPGETQALLDTLGIRGLELQRVEWEPYIAYAVMA